MLHSKFEIAADFALLGEVLTQFPSNKEVIETINTMLKMMNKQSPDLHVTGEEFVAHIRKKYNFD